MGDGIFTQPGPDGIFNSGGGPPGDASNPTIDSSGNAFDFGLNDAQSLRETLLVAYPSPGHMRVARAVVNAETGEVKEYQEQYREPSPDEVEWLRRKGVAVGRGSIVKQQNSVGDVPAGSGIAPNLPQASAGPGIPATSPSTPPAKSSGTGLFGLALAFAAGGVALWAGGKWVMPKIEEWMGGDGGGRKRGRKADDEDVEYDDEDED